MKMGSKAVLLCWHVTIKRRPGGRRARRTYRGKGHTVVQVAQNWHRDWSWYFAELYHVHQEENDVDDNKVCDYTHDDELCGTK
jgi:hypothetical protein